MRRTYTSESRTFAPNLPPVLEMKRLLQSDRNPSGSILV